MPWAGSTMRTIFSRVHIVAIIVRNVPGKPCKMLKEKLKDISVDIMGTCDDDVQNSLIFSVDLNTYKKD